MRASIINTPGTLRPLFRLVWPVLIEQLLVMMVGFSDTLLAGHYLTETHLAAMTVINYLLWMFVNLFAVVSIGAVAMTARFVGAGDWPMANRVTNQSLLLGGLLAAVFTTIGILLAGRLPELMQLEGEPAALASGYLRYVIPLLPAMMLEAVGIGCLRGAGDMFSGLVTMTLVNVVNVVVAWSLLLGIGPLPALGWSALPIGAACGFAIGGLVPLALLLRGRAGLTVRPAWLKPDFDLMRRILRIGLPGGTDILLITTCQLLFLSMVADLGEVAAAAHGVALRIESLSFLPGFAFQVASATLVGQYLGAREFQQARKSVLAACLVSGSFALVASLAMYFDSQQLVGLLINREQVDVAAIAPPLLRIVSVAMVPLGIMQVLTGALRGAGDTRWPLVITIIGFLGVRIPTAYLLTHYWLWGVEGAWYAMVADVLVRAGLITTRFFRGAWHKIEV